MDIFNILTMIGGLSLFLFGMSLMGQALERRAGERLRTTLSKMTSNRLIGFLTGCGVTAVIQSSSATTIMVVGFVNSGLMTLKQAINVIMGANVGTTVTSWLLSLGGIDSGNVWVRLLKPSSFTPVLAGIGIINYLFCRSSKRKDTGMIFLGFATLMFGMETMSSASVQKSASGSACRSLFDGGDPVQLGLGWYSAGVGGYGAGLLCSGGSHYYGAEYRNLRYGAGLRRRGGQKCKAGGLCASEF